MTQEGSDGKWDAFACSACQLSFGLRAECLASITTDSRLAQHRPGLGWCTDVPQRHGNAHARPAAQLPSIESSTSFYGTSYRASCLHVHQKERRMRRMTFTQQMDLLELEHGPTVLLPSETVLALVEELRQLLIELADRQPSAQDPQQEQ